MLPFLVKDVDLIFADSKVAVLVLLEVMIAGVEGFQDFLWLTWRLLQAESHGVLFFLDKPHIRDFF